MYFAHNDKLSQQLFDDNVTWQLMSDNDVEEIRLQAIEAGRCEGRYEERMEIGQKLLAHFDDQMVSDLTGLSLDVVVRLRENSHKAS